MKGIDLSGLAQLAGVPLLQARNWTSGRPLSIRPSVQVATGTGTRNLYSDSDVLKLAIANKLRNGSVGFRAIRYVIETVEPEQFVYGYADWLIVLVRRDDSSHRAVRNVDLENELISAQLSDTETVYFFVHLSKLLGEVQTRIDDFVKDRNDGLS